MSPLRSQLHPLLLDRWSPRAFSDRSVTSATLATLLEAARWAPSCYNDQPWNFIVARREDASSYQNVFDCLVPQNQAWARTAPVLMLAVARLHFAHNATLNRHAWYDLGLAVANLIVQATHLQLSVHQMAGFDPEEARRRCEIPAGFEPAVAIALGYRGDPSRLPAGVAEKDPALRERHEVTTFAFAGRWGVPFTAL